MGVALLVTAGSGHSPLLTLTESGGSHMAARETEEQLLSGQPSPLTVQASAVKEEGESGRGHASSRLATLPFLPIVLSRAAGVQRAQDWHPMYPPHACE